MRQFLFSRTGLVLGGFLIVAVFFLWTEHQAHFIAALPWLLIGGCLVMHLFMHGGHGGHGTGKTDTDDQGASDHDHRGGKGSQ